MNRKKLILFILLVLFGLSLAYSFIRMPRQATVANLKYEQGKAVPARKDEKIVKSDDNKLHLEWLDNLSARSSGFRRNIFRPIFHEEMKNIPLPPPPPKPAVKPPASSLPAGAGPGGMGAQPTTPEPPAYMKDMATFTFLGFVKKDNKKTMFLSKGGEIFLAKIGDKIAEKYEVTNITDEVLTINIIAEGREIIIPLTENKSLAPAKK